MRITAFARRISITAPRLPEDKQLRSKLVFALIAAAAIGLMLISRGCSERKETAAATKVEMADKAATADRSQSMGFSLSANDDEGYDLPEREEIRQKRKLTPGTEVFVVGVDHFGVDTDHTQVFVIGIDGRVKVETADTDTAEVLIVRSARKREDLLRRKVEIRPEDNNENLHIHVGDNRPPDSRHSVKRRVLKEMRIHDRDNSSPESLPEIRQRVVLRLPRKSGLEIRQVGGDVTIGGVGGHLRITEVIGNVRVTGAAGPVVVGNTCGDIDITFAPLKANSVRIGDDIIGNVELRFEGDVNADLNASSVNGAVKPDFPNVAPSVSEPEQGRLKARIGNGGFGIEIDGVNGNVTLSKAGDRDASVSKDAAKSEQRRSK
jgi:hypothetical protein